MIKNEGLTLPARSGGSGDSPQACLGTRSEPSANIGKISETGKRRTPNGDETEENRGGFLTFTIVKKYDNPPPAFYKSL